MQSRTSTAVITKRIRHTATNNHQSALNITFTLPEELHDKFASIGEEIGLIQSGSYAIEELTRRFNHLVKLGNEKRYQGLFNSKRIHIERYKLAIIEAIRDYLKQFYTEKNNTTKNKKPGKWRRIQKWIKFGMFLFGDLIWFPSGIYFSYVGFRALMPLIFPAITNIVMLPIAIVLTIIDIGIQVLFKTITFKDKLKMPIGHRAKRFLDVYEQQLKSTTKINELLHHPMVLRQIKREDFHSISYLALKFTNKDIAVKKAQLDQPEYKPYGKEHIAKSILRWAIRGFKIFTTITGGFFAAQMLVGLAFAPLLGTPAGWALIVILVAGLLAMYLATMHYDSLKGLFSPSLERFNQVKSEFDGFTVVKDFRHIYNNKRLFKRDTVSTSSLSTTEPIQEKSPAEKSDYRVNDGVLEETQLSPAQQCKLLS